MSLTTLYHGTDDCSAIDLYQTQSVNVKRGLKHTDFGRGFYLTDDFNRAAKWAMHKAMVRGRRAAVVSAEVDLKSADAFIEKFHDDLRWGRFIVNTFQYAFHTKEATHFIKKMTYQMI